MRTLCVIAAMALSAGAAAEEVRLDIAERDVNLRDYEAAAEATLGASRLRARISAQRIDLKLRGVRGNLKIRRNP
jgi:hypothetical protein